MKFWREYQNYFIEEEILVG